MFEYSHLLLLLLMLPFIFIAFFVEIFLYRKRTQKIAGANKEMIIPYFTEGQKWIRNIFYTIGFIFIVLSVARPKWGIEEINQKIVGRDILVLIDVSVSMSVPDVFPTRLELVKRTLNKMLDSGVTDRIGIMVFTSETELLVPLTHDYSALSYFIDSIHPGMIGTGGTDISKGLVDAISFFDDSSVSDKMILLITDGEDLSKNKEENITKIKKSKIKVYTVGVGTTNGQPVPVRNEKGEIESYLRDRSGNPVVSKLDESFLKELSTISNGTYFRASTISDDFITFINTISAIKRTSKDNQQVRQIKDQYILFLGPALFFLCIGFLLDLGKLYKKEKRWVLSNIFNKTILIFSVLFVFNLQLISQENVKNNSLSNSIYKNGAFLGNHYFNKKDYSKALKEYARSINSFKQDNLAKLHFNIASVFEKMNDFENADKSYAKAIENTKNELILSDIYYNRGIINFKNKKIKESVSYFKESLKNNPTDEARYNYSIAKLFLNQENSENKDDDKEKSEDKSDKEQSDSKSDEQKKESENFDQLLKALEQKEKNDLKDVVDQNKEKSSLDRGVYW
ncbi:MAG: hypothetical protein A2015_06960 [Spirochaetes bacterium GWF1_31_7]|nr:MAG: hypothetical protein A2Y30_09500 [Spirochaetes bacterium GWE1_32_154]OHD46569.1 MAG: hypothetical protein A2015_06960 [Spirochaetes bacterium GWF1_31_7]